MKEGRRMQAAGAFAAVFFCALVQTSAAHAGWVEAHRCWGCTTDQAKDVAVASGRSPAYVYDFRTGNLQYAGGYRFTNGNTSDADDWVRQMARLGVTVTNPANVMADCTWDGRTLTCSFQ